MDAIVTTLSQYVGTGLASLIAAVLALLIGWLIAALVAGIVRALLKRVQADNRMAQALGVKEGAGYPIEHWASTLIFWFIFLFFVVGALELLHITQLAAPINALLTSITAWLPALFAAAILALIAHVLGTILRKLTVELLERRKVDERLAAGAGAKTSIGKPLGDAVYYLVWLLFLPAILGAIGLQGLLMPVQNMLDQFLRFVPFLAAAAILLVVGWFVARIVQRIVTSFLASAGADEFAERIGIAKYMGRMTISALAGLIVFVLILIPVITAALDALNLDALTAPLTAMLNNVITAIPNYVAAAAILLVTYVLARWLIGILVEILSGVGVNKLPQALGLGAQDSIGGRTLAQWIGDLALLIVMLLAAVQAAQVIGWGAVTVAIGALGTQIVQIIFGLFIIAIGVYLGNLAARFVNGTTAPNKSLLALVARVAIIAFAGAMGLTAMGFAEQIVVIAFGLFFGAIAIAVALAFGLGGRETASKHIAAWSDSLNQDDSR